ncbi:hypothetical protein [Enhydrobacter sp.]|jgi:hypothetical protein|uniref:hypothetical protein n=1 Tax=Enhydrobacter sp. TaxID=1894999 RepID=UPI002624B052|nr:hypothetical protein [Enhydrobacter sp.]WIM09295.1 MAG: hypothetical protein OJF58_000246 [Enhydrobacter sp.]
MTVDPTPPALGPANIERRPVTRLEVRRRESIWEITSDGRLCGHYDDDQPAFDAAEAMALALVADGGAADLLWTDARPQSGVPDRIIEFRSGSTTIVCQRTGSAS